MDKIKNIIDEYHNTHIIDKEIGAGGQGTVYRTRDEDIAIKISNKPKEFNEKIEYLSILPIPADINITRPIALLKNKPGYVMRLLNYMKSIDTLRSNKIKKDIQIPGWLKGIKDPKIIAELIHYRDTGSLRKRLSVLSKVASILSELHSLGMTYGDISDSNVFISEKESDYQVWLIDPDNIQFHNRNNNKKTFYTPKYGAPEIVQNKSGFSFESDCYSFAILAYWTLSLNHPFIGEYVTSNEGDWEDDNSEDFDEKAYAGHIPWINDLDDINATKTGLPQGLILTDKLKKIFQKTFTDGRITPSKRPTIFQWAPLLIEASDKTIKCSNCQMHFYYEKECPYCKSKPSNLLIFTSYLSREENNQKKNLHWKYIREFDKNKINLPHRLLYPFCNKSYDDDLFAIYESNNKIHIERKANLRNVDIIVESENQSETFSRIFDFHKNKFKKPIKLISKDEDLTSIVEIEMFRGEE